MILASCQGTITHRQESLTGDPSQPNCGFAVGDQASRPRDACLDGVVLAGPVVYTRQNGQPMTENLSFTAPDNGTVCLHVVNGEVRGSRVSSAVMDIDGAATITPNYFNPGVEIVQARRGISQGDHVVATTLTSQPGDFLSIEVRFVPEGSSPHGEVTGTSGHMRLFDALAAPQMFSPNADGVQDQSTISVVVAFNSPVPGNAGKATYEVTALAQFASGESCQQVAEVSATSPLASPQTTRLAVVWDGRDGSSNVVPDGVYFYRVVVQAYQVHPSGTKTLFDTATTGIQAVVVGSGPDLPIPPVFGTAPLAPGPFVKRLPAPQPRRDTVEEAEARNAASAAIYAPRMEVNLWINRYKQAAVTGTPSLVFITLVSDDGPVAGQDLRASTWTVTEQLAGPTIPASFVLTQPSPGGENVSDGMLGGRIDRTYVVIVEQLPDATFRLAQDSESGTASFGLPVGVNTWQFERGPRVTLEQFQAAAGVW